MVSAQLRVQFLEATASLIIAAFGLVAALAWNETIKALIASLFPNDPDSLLGLTTYAVIVTVVAVIATLVITNSIKKAKAVAEKEEKE